MRDLCISPTTNRAADRLPRTAASRSRPGARKRAADESLSEPMNGALPELHNAILGGPSISPFTEFVLDPNRHFLSGVR